MRCSSDGSRACPPGDKHERSWRLVLKRDLGSQKRSPPAQALDEMQVQGHRPDVGIYNTVLEVLTRSGVLSAQLKAAQLFQAATRQGQLRMMPQGKSDLTCIAFMAGAAVLAVLQWLQDLRYAIWQACLLNPASLAWGHVSCSRISDME